MEIKYSVIYHELALKDISVIQKAWRGHVKKIIEEKLQTHPEIFGKPLRQSLVGYRSVKVGYYRIVFRIENTTVKIFGIIHRKEVYKIIEKRIS